MRAYHGVIYDGIEFETSFTTITPPNGPSCTRADRHGFIVAPSSAHSGGVNAALGDGSIRFISDSIDVGTGDGFGGVGANGESPFGVWGAMGSRDGGESKSL